MFSAVLRAATLLTFAAAPAPAAPATTTIAPTTASLDTVAFAGGCFWGVQAVFQHVKGVVTATSGYSGGTVANPDYELVSSGTTGHAETVRVVYDPAKVSYQQLLTVFFTVAHDPTELNRQGPDVGTQYRSALFYTSEAQRQAAQAYIAQLDKSGTMKGKVVTQLAPLRSFTVAEAHHQDYATLHPDDAYIRYNDAPKVAALKQQLPQLWNDRLAAH
jgi:peptide-methionine (S)-S-oxide reductase